MQLLQRKKRDELTTTENTLALMQTPASESQKSEKWASTMKEQVFALFPGMNWSYPGMVDRYPSKVWEQSPGIETATETLRALHHRLNLTVTLWWKPRGPRNFSIERGLLKASFGSSDVMNLSDGTGSIPRRFDRLLGR